MSALPYGAQNGFTGGVPGPVTGLDAKVLVLNRYFSAIRVIDARRAFVLLAKEIAEVVAVEDGSYVSYPFTTWTEIGRAHV